MAIELKQRLDYTDHEGLPADGRRYEILDGDLLVTPAPSPQHQRASKRLQRQLEAYFEVRRLGEVFNAPIDLILGFHDIVQPDLVLVTDPLQIARRGIEGAPTLVVEIVSPASRAQDVGAKRRRYAEMDIPHYWIVDPERGRLECYTLAAGVYQLTAEGTGDTTVTDPAWPELVISLGPLWD